MSASLHMIEERPAYGTAGSQMGTPMPLVTAHAEPQQGTAAWFAARCGKVTASRVADVVARTKTGWGAARAAYLAELVAERLTGQVGDSFTSPAMRWGQEWEAEARRAYEFHADQDVVETGFVRHPLIEMSGASPDGLVGADGLVEIKAPTTATHIEILTTKQVPPRYITQMMWQMACTERSWCDFASYDPRLPAHLRLFVTRVARDDRMIEDLEVAVSAFLEELDVRVMSLELLYGSAHPGKDLFSDLTPDAHGSGVQAPERGL